MPSQREHIIDNFSGGYRGPRTGKFAPNESMQIGNAFCNTGCLYTMPGRRLINPIPIAADYPVNAVHTYQIGSIWYILAHCEKAIWIGEEYKATISSDSGGTITVSSSADLANWPDRGGFLIDDAEIVTYTHRSATQLKGCSEHTTASALDTVRGMEFRPLVAEAKDKNGQTYILPRYPSRVSSHPDAMVTEHFCQVGTNVYISSNYHDPQVWNQSIRWAGFIYKTGKVKCVATDPRMVIGDLSGYTTSFLSAGVRRGDIIFLKAGGSWYSGGSLISGRTIRRVINQQTLELESDAPIDTTGKGVGEGGTPIDYVDYIIVRVHPMGVYAASNAAVRGTGGAGGFDTGLGTATHYFKWRYANSNSGYSGNISPFTSFQPTAGNARAILSGWGTYPTGRDVNQIEIFHSRDNATYFKLKTISGGTGVRVFPTATELTGTASLTTTLLEADAANHTQPSGGMGQLVMFNNRLYGHLRYPNNNNLAFSSLNAFEYWPLHQTYIGDPEEFDVTEGGFVRVGSDSSEPVLAIVTEGGAYSETGRLGSNLLIFTSGRAFRWFGYNWNDFKLEEAFHCGCAARRCVNNVNGLILWLGPAGPMSVSMGSSLPSPIYQKLFPRGVAEAFYRNPRGAYMNQWASAVWQGFWVVANTTLSDTYARRVFLYEPISDVWVDYSGVETSLLTDIGSLYSWTNSTDHLGVMRDPTRAIAGDSNTGYVWELFRNTGQSAAVEYGRYSYWKPARFEGATNPAGTQFDWLSAPLYLSSDASELTKAKQIRRITACWKPAQTPQSVVCSVIRQNNVTTPIFMESKTIQPSTTEPEKRVFTHWYPAASGQQDSHGMSFQVRLRGNFTQQVQLDWVSIVYVVEDTALSSRIE